MPYDIEFRESLPTTLVGKVAYRILEEEELAKIAAASEEEKDAPDAVDVKKEEIAHAVEELEKEEAAEEK